MDTYEKKYKEALERAKRLSIDGFLDAVAICDIFTELKESEDEKTRKEIMDFVVNNTICKDGRREKYLAWLEKQGEQTNDERYKCLDELIEADTIYQMAINDAMVEEAKDKATRALSNLEISKLFGLEKQGEQKSTWSDKDEKMLNDCLIDLQFLVDNGRECNKELYQNEIEWLKGIKNRVQS